MTNRDFSTKSYEVVQLDLPNVRNFYYRCFCNVNAYLSKNKITYAVIIITRVQDVTRNFEFNGHDYIQYFDVEKLK